MILPYLIFAHLLGDFIFQPTKLVLWKSKSKLGTLTHSLIHFFVVTLVLSPFILKGYWELLLVAFGLAFVHFWIDEAKINYDLKHDERVLPFMVDQIMHLITIVVAYLLIMGREYTLPEGTFFQVYGDIRLIIFLSFIVFVTTVIEVFRFQREREKNKINRLKINSDKMLSRVIIFSLLYSAFLFLSLYVG